MCIRDRTELDNFADDDALADEESADEDGADEDNGSYGGFFPAEPVASFGEAPNAADLVEEPPAPPRVDLEQSRCVNVIDQPVQVTGYLPIEVGGEAAEFLLFVDDEGNESGLIVDANCQPLG